VIYETPLSFQKKVSPGNEQIVDSATHLGVLVHTLKAVNKRRKVNRDAGLEAILNGIIASLMFSPLILVDAFLTFLSILTSTFRLDYCHSKLIY